ncbi:uncharacterized protein LOC124116572 [Haliotis rufescens]|uniref:uncharacterized protein LOC124116572 n=1 Tax=Haliotis rufescens TaxID=6454 RepID=UPI00201F60C2|nr:uncharacterized protein LOC124116572 [Haliotis rufescens]
MSGGTFARWGKSGTVQEQNVWRVKYCKLAESETWESETNHSEALGENRISAERWARYKPSELEFGSECCARDKPKTVTLNYTKMDSQKSKKQNDEEIRSQVLADDATKDIGVYLSVTIATVATLTALLGVGSVIVLRALLRFRPEIGGYWMSCIPFIFPGISGTAVAFKRHRTSVSVHVGIMFAALLAGGSCYGYSIEPVYFNNSNCTDIYRIGACDRPALLIMHLVSGGAATAFCLFGLLLSFCACSSVSKTYAQRAHDRELESYEEAEKQRQAKINAKKEAFTYQPSITTISEKTPIGNDVITPASNGVSVVETKQPVDDVTRL